jgi:hypothetical protein
MLLALQDHVQGSRHRIDRKMHLVALKHILALCIAALSF